MTKEQIIKQNKDILDAVGANPDILTKSQLLEIIRFRCKHRHSALSHPNCCIEELPFCMERVGFFDIETFGLKANFGVMFCYCIADGESNNIIGRSITKKEILHKDMDKQLVSDCIEDLRKFDRIIVHYGLGRNRHDVPFTRTRALYHGLEFPSYGEIRATDLYTVAKNKLSLNSYRQNIIAELFKEESDKTRYVGRIWLRAIQGDEESLKKIFDHCKIDVKELKENYNNLVKFIKLNKGSL